MTRPSRMYRKARSAYLKIEPELVPAHDGEFVAVDPVSGNYVVGPDELEVVLEASRRYPRRKFGFFRVGRRVVHKLR